MTKKKENKANKKQASMNIELIDNRREHSV